MIIGSFLILSWLYKSVYRLIQTIILLPNVGGFTCKVTSSTDDLFLLAMYKYIYCLLEFIYCIIQRAWQQIIAEYPFD
jgi:hypothetical protein